MVLSREQIKNRLGRPIADPKGLVVTPLLQEGSAFSTDSLDLRLGTHFLLPQMPPPPFGGLGSDVPGNGCPRVVHVPLGSFLVVQAHQTVLGATLEFIKLPADVSGQILTKSSVARTFVVIETAPWIHPCYRGCLTLEIANVSNTALVLHPGLPIGQLILLSVGEPVSETRLVGSYMGPVYPEAPVLRKVSESLRAIGVPPDRIRMPGKQAP
jgi:dCTP deaminase